MILRHIELAAYRCFLPDLAGFTGFYCTGPSPYSRSKPSSPSFRCLSARRNHDTARKSRRYTRNAVWRRGWDSNPRSRYRDACFPSMSIRPLSHLSASRSVKGQHLSMRVHDRQGEQGVGQDSKPGTNRRSYQTSHSAGPRPPTHSCAHHDACIPRPWVEVFGG